MQEGILRPDRQFYIKPMDIGKMRSTLKQFVREWADEGAAEREQSFAPIKAEFLKYFPNTTH